jgi:transposase
MRPKGSPAELERRRRQAVKLLKKGHKPDIIAEMLGCHVRTVFRWQAEAATGSDKLAAIVHPGPTPKLSDDDLPKLEQLLMKTPLAFGWKTELWSLTRVTAVIKKEFNIKYDPSQVCRILRQRLGWSSQKPMRRARERNEAQINKWQKEEFPHIKKR